MWVPEVPSTLVFLTPAPSSTTRDLACAYCGHLSQLTKLYSHFLQVTASETLLGPKGMNTGFASLSVLNSDTHKEAQAGPRSILEAFGQEITQRVFQKAGHRLHVGILLGPVYSLHLGAGGWGASNRKARERASCPVPRAATCSQSRGRLDFSVLVKSSIERKGERGVRGKGKNLLS